MATTEAASLKNSRIAWALLALAAIGLVAILVVALHRPPQMGADEEVFRTVDALYTAVASRDEKRLAECERRLQGYRAEARLPDSAADVLDGIIKKARAGKWEAATERLYDFMLAQRREGAGVVAAESRDAHKKKAARASKRN
jgi:hypothetical protein